MSKVVNFNEWPNSPEIKKTSGDFEDEPSACRYFDEQIAATKLFKIEREVFGYNLFQLPGKEDQRRFRIDRVLWPLQRLIDHGWSIGPVGIEIKTSGKKIGKVVSQCLDYLKSAFEHKPDGLNLLFIPRLVFIYPLDEVRGNEASLMNQNFVGCADIKANGHGTRITFKYGNCNVFSYFRNEFEEKIYCNGINSGRKQGSR